MQMKHHNYPNSVWENEELKKRSNLQKHNRRVMKIQSSIITVIFFLMIIELIGNIIR